MRSESSKMVLLRCSNCGSDLSGLPTDVIFYCGSCGRCWISGEKLRPVKIDFIRTGGPGAVLLPFWKVDASVCIGNRVTRKRTSISSLEGTREFSGRERGLSGEASETRKDRFIFPAFSTSLVLSIGVKMHRENFLPERTQHGLEYSVRGGAVDMDDACILARGVAVGTEVNRSDFLASVELDIEVVSASIYAIGCTPKEHYFVVNGSEISFPCSAVRDSDLILDSISKKQ